MRLPPLNALRAFESAARHGGFIGAAEELFVTRGAISRHVKLLEEDLGVPLFRRHARGVDLTPAGERLLPVLTAAFRDIAEGVQRTVSAGGGLRIICPPATSVRWLLPRLGDFRDRYPNIPLQVTTDFHGKGRFELSGFDLGFSVEIWPERSPNIRTQPFMPYLVTPACTPEIARLISKPADLSRLTLLRESPFGEDWDGWIKHFGVSLDTSRTVPFPNLDLAVKAATLDEGVVMVDLVLCRAELDRGDLVTPFPDMVCQPPSGAFAVIGPDRRWEDPDVVSFRRWVTETARADIADLPVSAN